MLPAKRLVKGFFDYNESEITRHMWHLQCKVKKEIQNAKAQSPGSADDEKDISAETNGGLATPPPNRKEAVSEKLASLSAEVQNKFDELRKQVGFPGDEQAGDVVIAL